MNEKLSQLKQKLDSFDPEFVKFVGQFLSTFPEGENKLFEPLLEREMKWAELNWIAELFQTINTKPGLQGIVQYWTELQDIINACYEKRTMEVRGNGFKNWSNP